MRDIRYCPPEVEEADVVFIFRRHWWALLGRVMAGMLLMLSGIVLTLIVLIFVDAARQYPWVNILLLVVSTMMFFGWTATFYGMILHGLTVASLTKQSLVDVDQVSLFNRKVSTMTLEQIQDVTVRQVGILPTYLNFGDVIVQTAGEVPEFIFDSVPSPHKLAEAILRAQETKKEAVAFTPPAPPQTPL